MRPTARVQDVGQPGQRPKLKLGKARWRAGDRAGAKGAIKHLLSFDDGNAEAHYVLAELLLLDEAGEEANREAQR